MPNNSGGHYKKATCVALQLGVANSGYVTFVSTSSAHPPPSNSGFIATFIYTDGVYHN